MRFLSFSEHFLNHFKIIIIFFFNFIKRVVLVMIAATRWKLRSKRLSKGLTSEIVFPDGPAQNGRL